MAEYTLVAETGREIGSRATRRLRRAGKIPGVVYGHGITPVPVAVDGRTLRHALNGEAGVNALLRLKLDGGGEQLTVAKVLQRDPVRQTLVHVDFLVVREDEQITADVTVSLVGEADKVREQGGEHSQVLYSLTVEAVPSKIPSGIEVDISNLEMGETIRVGDIELPEGVSTAVDPEEPVVATSITRVEEEPTEEGAEPAEAAEGAAAPEGEGDGQPEGGEGEA